MIIQTGSKLRIAPNLGQKAWIHSQPQSEATVLLCGIHALNTSPASKTPQTDKHLSCNEQRTTNHFLIVANVYSLSIFRDQGLMSNWSKMPISPGSTLADFLPVNHSTSINSQSTHSHLFPFPALVFRLFWAAYHRNNLDCMVISADNQTNSCCIHSNRPQESIHWPDADSEK